jgi:hypothetical protein
MLVESHGLSCLYCKAQNKPESKHKKSREMPVSVVVQRFCMLIKLYKTYNPFLVVRRLCLNFSIQHWKRAVASYEIPNQICLFWQRNAVHSLFVANMCECRRTGHKHSAKRALCKLQGKKFQLSRKRIGPIENKMTLDRMSLMIKLNGVEKIWPFSGRTLIVRKHWRHEVGVTRQSSPLKFWPETCCAPIMTLVSPKGISWLPGRKQARQLEVSQCSSGRWLLRMPRCWRVCRLLLDNKQGKYTAESMEGSSSYGFRKSLLRNWRRWPIKRTPNWCLTRGTTHHSIMYKIATW